MADINIAPTATNVSTTTPATSGETKQTPLIVTSGASRATFADNVTKLQSTTSNLGYNNPSIVDFLNTNKMPSDYNSRAAMAKEYGIEGYTGSADQNTKLLGILRDGGKNSSVDPADPTKTAKDATVTDPAPTNPKNATGTGDGNGGGDNNDGGTSSTDSIVKNIKDQYSSALVELDSQITNAKRNLSQMLSTLQNDPAASSAINMIMQKYDQQIEIMKDKNKVVLGSVIKNAARSGALQYANEMTSNFFSEEQDKASKRVADLITTEMNMVLKAQESYKKGNVSAFNAASKELDRVSKEKIDTVNKLLDATNKAVKAQQDQQKLEANKAKQQISDDIRVSSALGKTVADTIKNSGITDPKKIKVYVDAMAKKSGISNPDILNSAVVKAQQEQAHLDLTTKNVNSAIDKRNNPASKKAAGGGTDGSYKYTSDEVSGATDFLNNGNEQTGYKGRDENGYVDPKAYSDLYKNWVKQGGTPQGFTKKFPVTNVNPDDYSKIPKALQPKAKAAAQIPL